MFERIFILIKDLNKHLRKYLAGGRSPLYVQRGTDVCAHMCLHRCADALNDMTVYGSHKGHGLQT